MNKRGQALVEFVIILPIFLMLFFVVIDFGRILFTRISLENISNDVVKMYKNNEQYNDIEEYIKKTDKNATFKIENENNKYINFYLSSKVEITTPGLNVALENPYEVEVSRSIYNET